MDFQWGWGEEGGVRDGGRKGRRGRSSTEASQHKKMDHRVSHPASVWVGGSVLWRIRPRWRYCKRHHLIEEPPLTHGSLRDL